MSSLDDLQEWTLAIKQAIHARTSGVSFRIVLDELKSSQASETKRRAFQLVYKAKAQDLSRPGAFSPWIGKYVRIFKGPPEQQGLEGSVFWSGISKQGLPIQIVGISTLDGSTVFTSPASIEEVGHGS